MDQRAYHTLQILDHVEKSPLVTNRKVATKLNVSVKLAHTLLGQLVHKGLLSIQKRNYRRWDYFLTPKGIAEKAVLTYEFLGFTMQFYRAARRRSSEVLAQARKAGVARMAFLGASELAEIAYLGIQEQKLLLVDVFDDARANQEFLGLKVRPLAQVGETGAEKILVTAFDPTLPMGENFLPDASGGLNDDGAVKPFDLRNDPRLLWIFGAHAGTAPATARKENA